MTTLRSLGLHYVREDDGPASLQVLDQSTLPDVERWLDDTDPETMVEHIVHLRVRGAPMIGVCAVLSLACSASGGTRMSKLHDLARALRSARPTAVNLMQAIDTVLAAPDPAALVTAAEGLFADEVARCASMAEHGAALLQPGERVLTHCNTGGLATPGIGTAFGVVRRAHALGRVALLWVDETRPLLQGGRLTAWESAKVGIPYRLITDSTAASLMAQGQVDRVLVGADRIASNGDFANKIGTYALAVLARFHGLPFHVVAPRSTIDPGTARGADIPIEQRDPAEVRGLIGRLRWAPARAPVANPAFDVTPAELVTSWVLDSGVRTPVDVAAGALVSDAR